MLRLSLRFLAFCAAFLVLTTLTTVGGRHFDRIEAWFWGDSFGGGSTNLRMPEFVRWSESNPLPGLLFLGSSTCYRGIDPHPFEVAGLSSFNLGSSAQPLSTSQFVLDFALEYVTPRRIVLDLYKGVWLSDGFNSRRDFIINNNLADADAFQKMALETGDPFFIMQSQYFSWKRGIVPLPPMHPEGQDVYMGLGFVASNRDAIEVLPCEIEHPEMLRENQAALAHIAQACERIGAELILLAPPMTCHGTPPWPEDYSHLRRLDGNDWPESKTDSMYYDNHHLRGVGADRYSKWLASQLMTNFPQ